MTVTTNLSDGASAEHAEDAGLIAALRAGDERAFADLIDTYHAGLLRLASVYCQDRASAEDVVQETWIGVMRGIDRFEGRSSLKTWLFRILTNRAKTRAQRDGRTIPFSAVFNAESDPDEPAVDPDRFRGPDQPWPGHWASPPRSWETVPEERFLGRETREAINDAIELLPPAQREVITLRDVQGWSSLEVCNVLGISESNQRVLLHRARSKVRRALEHYLADE